jgi:predicted nucleic acid-binding protein
LNATFVADASVALSWVFPSQASVATDDLLDRVMSGSAIAVPSLWPYEVSNALVVLLRRKKMLQQDYLAARVFFQQLRASIDDGGEYFAGDRTADLAIEHGLTVYDAAYLELAIRKHLALASRDTELNRAAKRCGLRVLL